ncbi:glycosyltransferase family 2 protein [Mucilaginibacter celer]|uniref:Glycosyltransferase n=1 Tax=Mucilaginibacter celer TaxID=2305508 RepID=A0A494VMB6_9SPHI|nr:glycosyltransferase family 2 protein [Mucilaginibacter celer]AYL95259.1 glycosyltransferase [Mucilaginibacter celer]
MISVIIPCYNSEDCLPRAVQSVLSQSYHDTELILVNNNSTDGTWQLLEGYEMKYPDKVFICNELKPGAPAARNAGLNIARGEWIQFLDADDELLPDKLLQQFTIALKKQADVVIGGSLLRYNTNGNIKEIWRHTDNNVWRGLISSNLGITSSNLWRRNTLLKVSGWDESQTSSQEYHLLFRLLKNGAKIAADKAFNTIIYFSGDSVSKSTDSKKLAGIFNRRIDLRTSIKQYLIACNRLTPMLSQAIDNYIYAEAMRMYPFIPDDVTDVIMRHAPKVNWLSKFKQKSRSLLKRLSRL